MERYIDRGLRGSQAQELLTPWSWGMSPTWKLSELHTTGIFVEASSRRHDQLLTPFPALLSSQENGGWAENSKLLIMAWSFQ